MSNCSPETAELADEVLAACQAYARLVFDLMHDCPHQHLTKPSVVEDKIRR